MSGDECTPLLSAKARIDDAIAGYLDKVAALRKRSAAIDSAINILRSGDDELLREAPRAIRTKVVDFDEAKVESRVIEYLRSSGPLSLRAISNNLINDGLVFSEYGLRRVIKTSPSIKSVGQRDQT